MAEGRVLEGVVIDTAAPIEQCRSCSAPIWWGRTATRKRNPFDVVLDEDGVPVRSAVTHFSTCPDARTWSTRG